MFQVTHFQNHFHGECDKTNKQSKHWLENILFDLGKFRANLWKNSGEHSEWVGNFLEQHLFENVDFGGHSVLINMTIRLFCCFDCLLRFTHFGEHYRPQILVRGTPLHFSQLWIPMGKWGISQERKLRISPNFHRSWKFSLNGFRSILVFYLVM